MTAVNGRCAWCAGDCSGVDDTPLRGEPLDWLWQRLAGVGDYRGDQHLVDGTVTVVAPADASQRAAVSGRLGHRAPAAGQRFKVELAVLTTRLHDYDERLTPGMLAAHVTRRSLGEQLRRKAHRRDQLERLRLHLVDALGAVPETAPYRPGPDVWPTLRRNNWAAKLLAADESTLIVDQAAAIIAALPPVGERADRRRLADALTGSPHALDAGTLPGLVLAILTAAGHIKSSQPSRVAWAALGVDCDDLTGGLLALGIHPAGWALPADTVVTLPPRELARCAWPEPPGPGACVFVTENPSVVTAAADLLAADPTRPTARLLCTVGTPSAAEIDAIGRLASTGWQVAVRADFDQAGLNHVAALLAGVPTARPWRMSAADYRRSLADIPAGDRIRLDTATLPPTPWDPALLSAMKEHGLAGYEESLIGKLLADLTHHGQARLEAM